MFCFSLTLAYSCVQILKPGGTFQEVISLGVEQTDTVAASHLSRGLNMWSCFVVIEHSQVCHGTPHDNTSFREFFLHSAKWERE